MCHTEALDKFKALLSYVSTAADVQVLCNGALVAVKRIKHTRVKEFMN